MLNFILTELFSSSSFVHANSIGDRHMNKILYQRSLNVEEKMQICNNSACDKFHTITL